MYTHTHCMSPGQETFGFGTEELDDEEVVAIFDMIQKWGKETCVCIYLSIHIYIYVYTSIIVWYYLIVYMYVILCYII